MRFDSQALLCLWQFPYVGLVNPAPGINAVQVWMQRQVLLAPGMEDGDYSYLGTQKFETASKIPDHALCCLEQQTVYDFGSYSHNRFSWAGKVNTTWE